MAEIRITDADKDYIEVEALLTMVQVSINGGLAVNLTPDQARTLANHLLTLANKAEDGE